ncbi:MAG TPA: hypothetical protein VN622_11240 [Clostridia bacterium]|nr:hypothetical protein [Clostridia bacterium]
MITREAIRELAQFESPEGCAISFFYQPGTPQNQSHREEAILVKDLVRAALKTAEKEGRNGCARDDLQRILDLADQLHGNGGRAKAIFADAKRGVWKEFNLPAWLSGTQLIVNNRFHLRPLAPVVERHPRVVVCLLDRTKARLFAFRHDEIRELVDFFNDLPRRGRSDGWAGYDAGHAERKVANDAMQHYKFVADALLEMHDRGGLDSLVIGCRDENWNEIESQFHPYVRQKLSGRFRIDPATASPEMIREQVQLILDEHELNRRHGLVHEVLGEAQRNARGAIGLRRVLRSLEKGEVQTMLIGEHLKAPGSECSNCGHLGLKQHSECSICGQETRALEDLADAMIGNALRNGIEVVYIQNDPDFEKAGNVAALLRFRADQNTAMKMAS